MNDQPPTSSSGAAVRPVLLTLVLLAAFAAVAAGCSQTPRSTRLQASDFDHTIETMVQSLVTSAFLAERSADSEPLHITINKVENLTNDIIPVAEQWMLLARVQGRLSTQRLWEQYRIRFQITPEQHDLLRQAGYDEELDASPRTTHVMSAVFVSSPRVARGGSHGHVDARTDRYYLEYAIHDVEARRLVWTDTFEFAREARGLSID